MAFSKALKTHDPEDPDWGSGLKSTLDDIFVPHNKYVMVIGQAMILVGLKDLLVAQVQAAKMAGIWAGFWAGSKISIFGENKLFCIFLLV